MTNSAMGRTALIRQGPGLLEQWTLGHDNIGRTRAFDRALPVGDMTIGVPDFVQAAVAFL